MYSVTIRDSVMIAHSLKDPFFGPAQRLHGATFVVDVGFFSETLDEHNVVINIDQARQVTSSVLDGLRYRNLDDELAFAETLSTAEYVARYIHDQIVDGIRESFGGRVRVGIRETHDAWVSYEGPAD